MAVSSFLLQDDKFLSKERKSHCSSNQGVAISILEITLKGLARLYPKRKGKSGVF
jgi:hypothetical protein